MALCLLPAHSTVPRFSFISKTEPGCSHTCGRQAGLDKCLCRLAMRSFFLQAKGMRPYMEDRHTIVSSFQPRTSTGQAVQVRSLGCTGKRAAPCRNFQELKKVELAAVALDRSAIILVPCFAGWGVPSVCSRV